EISELGDFHAVEPDFPAKTPGAQGGRFPVVLDEAHVVNASVQAEVVEGLQIKVLDVQGRGLGQHLELVVVLQTQGVFAVAAVGGAAAGLHVGGVPAFRTDGPQKGGGVEGACPHFHVQRLDDDATVVGPELLQREYQALEGRHIDGSGSAQK